MTNLYYHNQQVHPCSYTFSWFLKHKMPQLETSLIESIRIMFRITSHWNTWTAYQSLLVLILFVILYIPCPVPQLQDLPFSATSFSWYWMLCIKSAFLLQDFSPLTLRIKIKVVTIAYMLWSLKLNLIKEVYVNPVQSETNLFYTQMKDTPT